jgi:hypothetical protein
MINNINIIILIIFAIVISSCVGGINSENIYNMTGFDPGTRPITKNQDYSDYNSVKFEEFYKKNNNIIRNKSPNNNLRSKKNQNNYYSQNLNPYPNSRYYANPYNNINNMGQQLNDIDYYYVAPYSYQNIEQQYYNSLPINTQQIPKYELN